MNVIAIDVGTTSVRLAILSFYGDEAQRASVLASHQEEISHYQERDRFEQSSIEIWAAICKCSKACIKKSGVNPRSIRSIAFSATCSLVIMQEDMDADKNDIIMWMDHRAIKEAQMITNSNSEVLHQFGGTCSPEFSLAKLLWLKRNEPERFRSSTGFFELPDWLVYRCIGGSASSCPRSLCCVTCKWGYDVESNNHRSTICGLDMLDIRDKIGRIVLEPGKVAGVLSDSAACDLGLLTISQTHDTDIASKLDIVVATSLIDAHSGMLAMLSFPLTNLDINKGIQSKFCSLVGTSSCHMLLSEKSNFTPGVWGPYRNVIIDGYYLLEAGQSLSGRLIEMCIQNHDEGRRRLQNGEEMYSIIESLNQELSENKFCCDLHILPSFHGNRSPLANPRLRGGVYGLSANAPVDLLQYYVATVLSLAYETKFIIATLGAELDAVLISGGLMKNGFYMQTLADVLQCRTIRVGLREIDFMVMGSGLVARHAAHLTKSKISESRPLTKESIANIEYNHIDCKIYQPDTDKLHDHEKRYSCYREFVDFSQRVDQIMNETHR